MGTHWRASDDSWGPGPHTKVSLMLAMAMCNLLLHQEQLKCVPGLAGLPKAWPLRHSGAGVLSPSSPASPSLSSLSPLFLWPSQPSFLDELFFSLTCYPLRGLISFSLPFPSTSVSSLHPKPFSPSCLRLWIPNPQIHKTPRSGCSYSTTACCPPQPLIKSHPACLCLSWG